jgi:asparagine synthase (glutamine-hydrolysing)
MCSINGIFAYHYAAGPIDERELLATRERMSARGPDGAGIWISDDARIGFAHRRLAVIDLSDAGAQPMRSAEGDLVITFNGEIYNYRELRRELIARGHRFKSQSDTEVLLHLYAEKGPDMVRDLRGMFAFALYDTNSRKLFLARDPYGLKPLYYADDGWTFRFASQVKALVAGGGVALDPDPAGEVGFYLFGHVPEPFTLHRAISALPAGATLIVDRLGARAPARYHAISEVYAHAEAAARPMLASEARARMRAALLDSVRHHLVADVPVGAFLSSGADSSALIGLMRDAGQREIETVTLGFAEFAGKPEDEAPLAAEVAAHYGAGHEVRRVGQAEFTADLPAILAAMDQPSIDGVNTWFVAKAAGEAGLKVALSGLGGDELLAGYPSFTDLPSWRRRYGFAASVPGLGALARLTLQAFAPGLIRERPKAAGMLEYAGSWGGAYLLRRGLFLPGELAALMDEAEAREGLHRLGLMDRLAATLTPDPGSDVGRVCALESSFYMRSQLLRDADWAGLAHSVEIRPPLVDIALLRTLAPALPGLTPGAGKRALAAAPSLPLPQSIAARAKTGFTVPTGAWMASAAARRSNQPEGPVRKGLANRGWSQLVFSGLARPAAPGGGASPSAAGLAA